MISILCPTYNHAAFLPAALDSIRAQTCADWELIIVNDASTDGTRAILDRYSRLDPRIRVIQNAAHRPVPENLNTALDLAKGEYLARIDSDDVWTDASKLDQQLRCLRTAPQLALVGTWATAIDSSERTLYSLNYPADDPAIRRWMLLRNPFVSSSIVMRTELARRCGGYNPGEETLEDYGLWLRLGTLGLLANIPMQMVSYRVVSSGLTWSRNEVQLRGSLRLIRAFRDQYPNFRAAELKWLLHLRLARLIGAGGLTRLRQMMSRGGRSRVNLVHETSSVRTDPRRQTSW